MVVGVCNRLLNPSTREAYAREIQTENEHSRKRHLASLSHRAKLVSIEEARAKAFQSDWASLDVSRPAQL